MVRRCLLLFLLGLTVLHAGRAQDAPHLYPIVENGKLGFIDASGKEAIPPRFEGYECFRPLTQFSEGLAPVHIDAASERWGYIETTGKLVLTLPAHYSIRLDLNGAFHEGVANVTITSSPTGGGLDRWAWIDRAGRLLYPSVNLSGTEFHEGLMRSRSLQLWGYVDDSFQWVIPPQFHTAEDFHEGIALVSSRNSSPDGWAYIDTSGKILFKDERKYRLSYPRSFSDGLAGLQVDLPDSHEYFEFVDPNGKEVIGPTLGMARDFHEGYAFVLTGPESRLALMDKRGEKVMLNGFGPNTFNSQFHEGLAAGEKDSLYGYIDHSGNWVIPPQFDYAHEFSGGLAEVEWRQKREWGYIDKRGQVVWKGVDQCHYPPF